MIAVAFLLLAGQARLPTVGDTVWITTTVPLPTRMILRPQTWDLGTDGQVLGPPEVIYRADSATIRYPIAFWIAGEHALTIPGPIVVSPEGRSDTLPNVSRRIEVGSVLPADTPKVRLSPRDPAPRVGQEGRSILPLGVGVFLAITIMAGAGYLEWRRRTRRKVVAPAPAWPEPDRIATVDSWARLGETRSALDGWSHLIEREVARRPDTEAAKAAAALLEALALAGFQPGLAPAESTRLLRAAREWWERSVR